TRAKLLSHSAMFFYSFVFAVITLILFAAPSTFPGVLGYASNIQIRKLLDQTNQVRSQHNLSTLVLNEKLSIAAQKKAEHMFANDYWAHVGPDGKEPWDFILAQDYDYVFAGENLAKNFNDSDDVVDAWFNSPSHRENLLGKNYDEVGFAVVNGTLNGYETTLVVQMFGRPRDVSAIATVDAQERLLASLGGASTVATSNSVAKVVSPSVNASSYTSDDITPVDVNSLSTMLAVGFALFLLILLAVDIWYSKIHTIPKFTGHSFAHLLFLITVIISILFVIKPGAIL
ncbi:CAP domain-containing protein, partial [candidate division WWE3 bacterium]|nr:CAP domain-containing protein [candidate division WWE3 bacterium]